MLVGVLLIAGCSAGPVQAVSTESPTAEESAAAASSSPTASAPAGNAVDLPFGAAEDQITGDWVMGWHDPFPEEDERFLFIAAADGTLAYSYRDRENQCTLDMEVFRLADHAMTEDDRLISDMMLASSVVESPSPEDIEMMGAMASEDSLWQEAEAATVDFRSWYGTSEETGSVVIAARGFGAMAAGMLLTVGCPPGADAVSEYKEIVADHARILVRWPVEG